jgi:hypothetical protein
MLGSYKTQSHELGYFLDQEMESFSAGNLPSSAYLRPPHAGLLQYDRKGTKKYDFLVKPVMRKLYG